MIHHTNFTFYLVVKKRPKAMKRLQTFDIETAFELHQIVIIGPEGTE
jgi:hypothetical protein